MKSMKKKRKTNIELPQEIELQNTKCPICKREMERYEDEKVEQLYCERCGVYYNV